MKFILSLSLILMSLVSFGAQAEDNIPTANKCVDRVVTIVVKSTRSVHYSEKDEGQLISQVTIRDCGETITVDKSTGTRTPLPANYCPPNVQDCVRP